MADSGPPSSETAAETAAAWGVADAYRDGGGNRRRPSPQVLTSILASVGADDGSLPPPSPVVTTRPGEQFGVHRPTEVTTEDGSSLRLDPGQLLPDLPLGYHALHDLDDGRRRTLVVSPGVCPLPARAPAWGWAAQLYAARSAASWGIGDLADLGRLGRWSARELGAGLTLVNPLHAAIPGLPQEASPYFPSSRRFRNPLYLRVEDVAGAASLGRGALGDELADLARAGRALDADRGIDRDAVYRLKMAALARLWDEVASRGGREGGGYRDFDRWRTEQGPAVEAYATFCVATEEHGRPWRTWPEELRHPDNPGVRAFAARHRSRVDFHAWLQWLLDIQLERASSPVPVVHDLAVGFHPDGADAWLWQEVVVPNMSVGAPPDEFNTMGQDWGLPPFDPWRLRAASYEPFVQTIRSAFTHAGGLRLDHVMGLFRLFWVPTGAAAADGTYVRYPAADLLDIVALESHRAGAYVVGEDLGTVEDEVREELGRRHVLSYRLLWFEPDDPARWPEQSMGAVTTHDLPTVAGVWSGQDAAAQRRLGMAPDEETTAALRERLADASEAGDDDPVDDVVLGAHRRLARAPSMLLTATLDDALAVEERPNMPGVTDGWPNWSIALPASLDDIEADPRPRRLASLLRRQPGDGDGSERL